jgi:hypothetical protein
VLPQQGKIYYRAMRMLINMEITATLHHDALDVEFEGQDSDEIQAELLDFINFIDENSEELDVLNPPAVTNEMRESESAQASVAESEETAGSTPQTTVDSARSDCFETIARRAQVDEEPLDRIFSIPEEENQVPYLRLDEFENGEEVLGGSRQEKQARGSLLLLLLWKECREASEVNSENLNNALHTSRIEPENRSNMYQAFNGDADGYFERDSGTVGLTQSGGRAAIDEVKNLVEPSE